MAKIHSKKSPKRLIESLKVGGSSSLKKTALLSLSLMALSLSVFFGARAVSAAQANGAGLPYSVLIVAGQSNAAGAESLSVDLANNIDVFGAQTLQPADTQVQMLFDNTFNNDSMSRINPVPLNTPQRANSSEAAIFGPEVGLARKLHELGRRRIVILKVTVGAVPLAEDGSTPFDWNVNSTNEAYQRLKERAGSLFESIEAQGAKYSVDGFYWMQGEADAGNTTFANQYEQNLRNLVAAAKTDFEMPADAKFVIGQTDVSQANKVTYDFAGDPDCTTPACITAKENNDKVREAQAKVAGDTENVEIVDTAPLARTGFKIHLSNVSQLELGKQFAEVTEMSADNKLPSQDSSVVDSVSQWDRVYNRERPQLFRDGGSSIKLGDKILWMFGDTLFTQESVDGTNARSSTAALAPANDPYNISEPLDANGAPAQFIPFSLEDEAHNNLYRKSQPNNRWLKWPKNAVNTSPTEGYVFYQRLRSYEVNGGPSLDPNISQIGIAKVTANSTTAEMVNESLFAQGEPGYVPTVSRNGTLFMHHCRGLGGFTFDYECATGKVNLEELTQRSAYTFWNGSEWVADINAAVYDKNNPNGNGSIAWSEWLQKYVQFYSRGFSGSVVMKTADSPEGPWSDSEFVFSLSGSEFASIFYTHPSLTMDDGKTLVISMNKNNPDLPAWSLDQSVGIFTFKVNLAAAADKRPDGPNNPNTPNAPKTGKLIGAVAFSVATIGLIVWAAKELENKKRISHKSSK